MSTVPTLFHGEIDSVPETVELTSRESDHVRALRLRSGDAVRVTNGQGVLVQGRMEDAGGETAWVRLEAAAPAPAPLPVELAFGVARKSRTLWLVEKAVELGAVALQPVECRRSRSVADAGRSEAFWEKARRRAVSALKQCGGARLPEIRPVTSLEEYVDERASWPGPAMLLSGDGQETLRERLRGWDGRNPARILLGPEGGLEEAEARAVRDAGWARASLGPRTLRFETAAIAALAVAAQEQAAPASGGPRESGTHPRRELP